MFNLGIFDFICIALVPIVAFIIAYLSRDKQPFSWRGYYFANAKLSSSDIGWTNLGANLAFSTIFIVLSEESYNRGWWVLVVPIAWMLGTLTLLWIYPKINEYAKRNLTLHQSIGDAFKSKSIAKWASLWTIISFIGTVGMEFYGGIKVLNSTGLTGFTPITFALIIALVVIIFTTLGGMRGIAKTASFLDILTAISALIILAILFSWKFGYLTSLNSSNSTVLPSPKSFEDNINFAIGMFLIFFPFQIFILDTWQRAAAWKEKDNNKRPTTPLVSSSLVIILVCIASIWTGVFLRESNISIPKDSLVLFEFLKSFKLILVSTILQSFIIGLILAGFIAAILSTADELLNCCSLSYIADTLGIEVRDDKLEEKQKKILASSGRLWTVLFGIIAVIISVACLKFEYEITAISVAVFSTQIVFIIPIYYTLFKKPKLNAPNNIRPVITAMLTSFIVSLSTVIYGIITKDKPLVDTAPLLALVCAFIVFFLSKLFLKFKKA